MRRNNKHQIELFIAREEKMIGIIFIIIIYALSGLVKQEKKYIIET